MQKYFVYLEYILYIHYILHFLLYSYHCMLNMINMIKIAAGSHSDSFLILLHLQCRYQQVSMQVSTQWGVLIHTYLVHILDFFFFFPILTSLSHNSISNFHPLQYIKKLKIHSQNVRSQQAAVLKQNICSYLLFIYLMRVNYFVMILFSHSISVLLEHRMNNANVKRSYLIFIFTLLFNRHQKEELIS